MTDRVGLQLYTVRDSTADDMLGTLRAVATMGYRTVEFAGYGDRTPGEIGPVLTELGLDAVAAHVSLAQLEDDFAGCLDKLRPLGCRWAVVPMLDEGRRADVAACRDAARSLDAVARRLGDEGLALAYHNHDVEFAPLDGATLWDVLVGDTDPDLVRFELDVYWAAYAGADPVELLERLGDRVPLVHAKDMAADEDRSDAPVGEGILDMGRIVAAAPDDAVLIVEQDHPRDAMRDVETSLRNLRRLLA